MSAKLQSLFVLLEPYDEAELLRYQKQGAKLWISCDDHKSQRFHRLGERSPRRLSHRRWHTSLLSTTTSGASKAGCKTISGCVLAHRHYTEQRREGFLCSGSVTKFTSASLTHDATASTTASAPFSIAVTHSFFRWTSLLYPLRKRLLSLSSSVFGASTPLRYSKRTGYCCSFIIDELALNLAHPKLHFEIFPNLFDSWWWVSRQQQPYRSTGISRPQPRPIRPDEVGWTSPQFNIFWLMPCVRLKGSAKSWPSSTSYCFQIF